MTTTRKHRSLALLMAGSLALGGLTACGDDDDDGIVDDDVEQDLSEGADDLSQDLSEGAEDLSDEVEEQVDEGAEENSDDG
jgi:hypothetical protein